jgi:hypothetical protein
MKQKTIPLFLWPLLAGAAFAEMDIPEAGRIRIDGNLSDWRRAEWHPLQTVVAGSPVNITNASWTTAWDEDAVLYIAVQYDDADLVFKDGTNAADCVEIYVRGDTGSSPSEYAQKQQSAQSYIFGLSKDKQTTWVQQGGLEKIPLHNRVKAAVALQGNTLTCELMVTAYDWFEPDSRHRCSESELIVGREIGLDVAIVDAGSAGPAGMLGSSAGDKRNDASAIAEQILDD